MKLKVKKRINKFLDKNKIVRDYIYKPYELFRPILYKSLLSNKFYLTIQPELLLAEEFTKENDFYKYDAIVRIIETERYLENKNYSFELYKKLIKGYNLTYKKSVKKFKATIESLQKEDYTMQNPIYVSRGQHIVGGNHRFAILMAMNKKAITCHMITYCKNIKKSKIHRLMDVGFTEKECKLIKDRKDKLFFEKGLFYPIIVKTNKGEIEKILKGKYRVYLNEKFELSKTLLSEIETLISKPISLFSTDEETKSNNEREKVTVYWIEVAHPNLYRNNLAGENNFIYSKEMRKLKKQIVKQFDHDSCIIGENNIINKEIRKILGNI